MLAGSQDGSPGCTASVQVFPPSPVLLELLFLLLRLPSPYPRTRGSHKGRDGGRKNGDRGSSIESRPGEVAHGRLWGAGGGEQQACVPTRDSEVALSAEEDKNHTRDGEITRVRKNCSTWAFLKQ